ALVLSVLGAAPSMASPHPSATDTSPAAVLSAVRGGAAAASSMSGTAAGAGVGAAEQGSGHATPGQTTTGQADVELTGESTSLLEGLSVPVADIDPEAVEVTGPAATQKSIAG